MWILQTELAQLDTGIVHGCVKLALVGGRQLLGAVKYLKVQHTVTIC